MKLTARTGLLWAALSLTGIGVPMVFAQEDAKAVEIVEVDGGRVSGVATDVPGVQLFKGIPFAGPTSGDNRFRAPQPVVPWDGVKIADTWGDQVLQQTNINPVGTFWGDEFYYDPASAPTPAESGLYLNVYTPAKTSADKLPVYLLLYGGGNHHGDASEVELYASQLAEKGIIVVAPQYRVGPMGFLSLAELSAESPDGASGNYAILDLVQALHWVHSYIDGFGGDPLQVTVGGQSAGAENATSLLRTPLAKGLFQRAIVQSGFTGIFPGKFVPMAERQEKSAAAITEIFGKEMSVADLRAISSDAFFSEMSSNGEQNLFEALHGATARPFYTVDGVVFTEESIDLLRPGALDGYDIMIGGTANEYSSLTGGPEKNLAPEDFIKEMVSRHNYPEGWQAIYAPADPVDAYRLLLRSRADRMLQGYLVSSLYAQAHNDDLNMYTYYFDHVPPGRNAEFYGAFHSSDLWYFNSSLRDVPGQRDWTDADYRMADTITSYVANFVKTGNPNAEGLPVWDETSSKTGGTFMRFADGEATAVTTTQHPERDALNRAAVLSEQKLDEADLHP